MSKTKSGKHYLKDLIAQVINDYAEHVVLPNNWQTIMASPIIRSSTGFKNTTKKKWTHC